METERIASYTLQYEIGSGGMSKVYFAVNSLNDPFAIKTLHSDLIHHETIRKRFRNEMEALKSLRDIEQVCQIKDYYEDGQQMAIVMEHLAGVDLLKYSRRNGPIPPRQLIGWMQDLLPAFVTCHARKIIHRDVKPSNFFLTDAGRIKILDFGIAKALDQSEAQLNSMSQGLTSFQEVIGSPMYMSPEQVRGLQQIDHRTDIYSLGVMIYTLLIGQNPYEGLSTRSNFDIQESVVKQPLPKLNGELAVFNPLIQKTTQKEPADRYQSVQLLLDDLNALMPKPTWLPPANDEPEIEIEVDEEPPVRPPVPIVSRPAITRPVATPPVATRPAAAPPVTAPAMPVLPVTAARAVAAPQATPRPAATESVAAQATIVRPVVSQPAAPRPATTPVGKRPILLIGGLVVLLILVGYLFQQSLFSPGKSSPASGTTPVRVPVGEPIPAPATETRRLLGEAARLLATLERLPTEKRPALFAEVRQTLLKLPRNPAGDPGVDSLYSACTAAGSQSGQIFRRTNDLTTRQDAIEWYRTAYLLRPEPALLTQIADLQTSVTAPKKITKPTRKPKSERKSSSTFALDPEVNH